MTIESETIVSILKNKFSSMMQKFRPCFKRIESFETGVLYIEGLLSKAERKNCWQIAENTGSPDPYKYQHLINRGSFSASAARDMNMKIALQTLGLPGVLAFDETGFIKKGVESAGVARQYSGTAGRIENSQIGVFASYKTSKGHSLIDRELYIPETWIKDKTRCKKAGIPEDQEFKTKPMLACIMYERFVANGHKASWVTADEAYGRDPGFIKTLENHLQEYILAVPKDTIMRMGMLKSKAEKYNTKLQDNDFYRISCGYGSKGERFFDFAIIERSESAKEGFKRYLLIRRNIKDKEDVAFYTVFAKEDKSLGDIVIAAGSRWSIEECFEIAKGETGLDEYEYRTYTGWYRHITLSMIAMNILVSAKIMLCDEDNRRPRYNDNDNDHDDCTKGQEHEDAMRKFKEKRRREEESKLKRGRDVIYSKSCDMRFLKSEILTSIFPNLKNLIEYTVQETRRLYVHIFESAKSLSLDFTLALSHWRRSHQAKAKQYHYIRQYLQL